MTTTRTRRQTSRIYKINTEQYVQISKEWSMKFGQNLYYVYPYGSDDDGATLGKFPSFKEAHRFMLALTHWTSAGNEYRALEDDALVAKALAK